MTPSVLASRSLKSCGWESEAAKADWSESLAQRVAVQPKASVRISVLFFIRFTFIVYLSLIDARFVKE
jgi:hypothetical protein